MSGRPRTSTMVLMGLFVGVFALYVLVRPASTGKTEPANPAPTPTGPVTTPAPTPTRTL